MTDELTLTLLHGWGCDSRVWQPVIDELDSRLPVQCLDIPFCHNEHPQQVDDIGAQLAEQLPEKTLLCGWSLGGMLAVRMAARYPQKIIGLVTLAANVRFVANQQWPHGMPAETFATFCDLFAESPEQALKRFVSLEVFGDYQSRAQKQWLQGLACAFSKEELLAGLILLAEVDNGDEYSKLSCPAWFCFGEKDSLVPVNAADGLHSILSSRQQVKILPDAGHVLHYPDSRLSVFLQECVDTVRSCSQ